MNHTDSFDKIKKIIFAWISSMIFICLFFQCIYANENTLRRFNCPYCGEAQIEILDDSTGICKCASCDGIFVVVNGKVKLRNGRILLLNELYDIEALIQAIENGEFDNDYEYDGNNAREYLEEDDEGEESTYEEVDPQNEVYSSTYYADEPVGDEITSGNSSLKSYYEANGKVYSSDYKSFEPETDEEGIAYLEKKHKKTKKTGKDVSTRSNIATGSIATKSTPKKVITDIVHVVRYYISIESEQYIPQVVYNGIEFRTIDTQKIEGFAFLGWSPTKDGKILIPANSELVLYNFDNNSIPASKVYDLYAIWEKEK